MPIVSQRSGKDERAALFPPELLPVFDESFITSFDHFDEYSSRLALRLFRTIGLDQACRDGADPAEAIGRLGLPAASALVPAAWILGTLAARNWITATAGPGGRVRYHADRALPELDADEILERQRAHNPECLASFDIATLAAAHYPAVLKGETSGEQALFGPEGILPWVRYFSNQNPLYAVSNKVGAVAAARVLPRDGDILEIGAGLGSGADTLLAEIGNAGLAERVGTYHLTEISPLFLKRARRNLSAWQSRHALAFSELDIDRPFPPEVAPSGSFSLVYGVNVLHVARDLAATLGELRNALRAGGMLVMAECVRPFADTALPIELVFNLLESFRNPVLVPGWRPNGGFLTPEQWSAALAANGFQDICIYPDIAAIRDAYPNFMVAAIVARRR